MLAIIVSYLMRKSLGAIGATPRVAVSLARRLAWILIEIVAVVTFLYIVAFTAASVGMYVVERSRTHQMDTVHGVSFKKYNVKPAAERRIEQAK